MPDTLQITNTISIQASPEAVWETLTSPEQTPKYMFGCKTVSDWQPGSPLRWTMMHEGKEFTAVKGEVVEIEPDKKLVYTVIDPNNSSIPDLPENYLTVTYELRSEADGSTTLTVTQGDYSTVADGQRRYEESRNGGEGWMPILIKIREVAEALR